MVNYTLFTNIIIYDLMDNNIGKLHFICAFHCFSQSYHDTVIIKIWLADCHFELKLITLSQRFIQRPTHASLNVYMETLPGSQYSEKTVNCWRMPNVEQQN